MKTIFLSVLLMLIVFLAQAQSTAPEIVHNNFKKMFTKAEKAKFSKDADGTWEVDFVESQVKTSAKFSATGEWLETEHKIKKSDLPKAITDMLAKDYKGWEVEEFEKVKMPNKDTFFELEVEKGKENYELKIDASGKVFEKTKAKKEGKE